MTFKQVIDSFWSIVGGVLLGFFSNPALAQNAPAPTQTQVDQVVRIMRDAYGSFHANPHWREIRQQLTGLAAALAPEAEEQRTALHDRRAAVVRSLDQDIVTGQGRGRRRALGADSLFDSLVFGPALVQVQSFNCPVDYEPMQCWQPLSARVSSFHMCWHRDLAQRSTTSYITRVRREMGAFFSAQPRGMRECWYQSEGDYLSAERQFDSTQRAPTVMPLSGVLVSYIPFKDPFHVSPGPRQWEVPFPNHAYSLCLTGFEKGRDRQQQDVIQSDLRTNVCVTLNLLASDRGRAVFVSRNSAEFERLWAESGR